MKVSRLLVNVRRMLAVFFLVPIAAESFEEGFW